MKDPQISKYLQRINLSDYSSNLSGLMTLQEHHAENIPFENLDIVVNRSISLNHQDLFEKIVMKNRGGYCFELNIFYAELLKSLGFSPKPVLGRVWLSNPKGTPRRNHLAHLLELEGKTYITDVGFAGLITRVPLDIHVSTPVNDKDGMVRILPFSDQQFMIQRQSEKGWENQYSFEQVEISEEDLAIANHYMSTHPNSHLFYHKCVGRNTSEGRIGLFNDKLTIRNGMKVIAKKRLEYSKEWLETIKNEFSLELDFTEKEEDVLFGRDLIR